MLQVQFTQLAKIYFPLSTVFRSISVAERNSKIVLTVWFVDYSEKPRHFYVERDATAAEFFNVIFKETKTHSSQKHQRQVSQNLGTQHQNYLHN